MISRASLDVRFWVDRHSAGLIKNEKLIDLDHYSVLMRLNRGANYTEIHQSNILLL